MLHKCGVRVYRRVEEAIASSSHLQWHHFDAGVVKVRPTGHCFHGFAAKPATRFAAGVQLAYGTTPFQLS